jgi:chaperonin GroEL
VRTALENAGSIISLMLTTEALVSELPEEKKAPASSSDNSLMLMGYESRGNGI